jgi:O-glycosyl hydrolase
MKTTACFLAVAALALCLPPSPAQSASVTINPGVKYQTMDGFGAAIAEWLYDHNNDNAYINTMVNDLGVSIMRIFLLPQFSPSQGTYTTSAGSLPTMMTVVTKFRQAGLPKICLSVFSPPAWMKDMSRDVNASCSDGTNMCGGHLATNMYDAYTEYYSRYIDTIQTRCGVPVYAISPENEPAWSQPYSSCVYTFVEMRDIVTRLGQRFAADHRQVKIFAAEDLQTNTWVSYARAIYNDSTAHHYADIVAIHQQNFDLTTSGIVANYRSSRQAIESYGVKAGKAPYGLGYWNSEIAGYPDGWSGALSLAQGFMISLRDGKMNLLMYGSGSIPSSAGQNKEALMVDRAPTPRYYAAKQFFRFIRPGAAMVDAPCDDSTIMAAAWVHPTDQTMTVVLVNTTATAKTVTLGGSDLPHFTAIRSSATETCDTIGTVGGVTTSVDLPASSITTLFATGYVTSVKNPGHSLNHGSPGQLRKTEMYRIDGRTVAPRQGASMGGKTRSPGLCVAVVRDGAGRITETRRLCSR